MLPGFYFVSSLGGTDKSIIPIGVSVIFAGVHDPYSDAVTSVRRSLRKPACRFGVTWVVAGGIQMRKHEVDH